MYRKPLMLASLFVAGAACSNQGSSDVTGNQPGSGTETITPAGHREAAQAGLATVAGLVRERNKGLKLGFRTAGEAASASLGDPLPIYRVGAGPLQAYHRGDDLTALMADTGTILYQSVVDGKPVSGILVGKDNGAWGVRSFGRQSWIQAAESARQRIATSRGFAPSALAFVEVETPQLTLMIRHVENGNIFLTSIVDLPQANLHNGETLPAEEALARLQSIPN
jgi:hypothetical protein